MENQRLHMTLLFGLFLTFCSESQAFTLIIKSSVKLKNLKVSEHRFSGPKDLRVGSNEIELENYPNAVYLMEHKSASNFKDLSMIWVPSDRSIIGLTIDADNNVTYDDENLHQQELNMIFKSSNHWSLFPYQPKENHPLEPILALEAKAIIQNMRAITKREVLKNLLILSLERQINNWSTDVLSAHLNEPNNIYNSGNLIQINGLDSLENQIEIKPNNEKYLLIAISGSWCGPCVKGIPNLRKSYDDVNDKILFVSLWNDPNLKTFRDNHRDVKKLISWPSLWDQYGVMANALNTKAYPTYILFDPKGSEINRWEGKLKSDLEDEISE